MTDHLSGGMRLRRTLIALAVAASAMGGALPAQTAYASTSVHQTISKYVTAAGFGSADVSAMMKIADYESHDHPGSHSRSCWGLFQLSTSMVKGHPWADASWNTRRAVSYVKSRYGSPRKALAHIKKTGWY